MTRLEAPPLPMEPRLVDDWRELPLHAGGRSLIEASAGTGKTWTISVLYLRLLLEGDQPFGAARIAVTTFTEAAAQELQERLRQRLAWAEQLACRALDGTLPACGDGRTDEAWLHARWSCAAGIDVGRVRTDLNRLRLAQVELDLAPISTLHGFCRRVLSDFPFECGSAFLPDEMACSRTLHAELVQDLWRELVQSSEALDPGAQAWLEAGRDALARALEQAMAPGVAIRALDEAVLHEVMQAAHAARLRDFVGDGSRFKSARSVLMRGLSGLADYIDAGDPAAPWPATMDKDLRADPQTQFKPAQLQAALDSSELVFAQRALTVLKHAMAPVKAEALQRFRDRLHAKREKHLRERGLMTFDAQIQRVHAALHGDGAAAFAERLHEAWPVMLVDEFQDTDTQQFAIVDRIYRDHAGAPRGRLVMIGDPKQAIYRFRGGDIHAYLAARAGADTLLHLQVNHRSSRALVGALNEWHALAGAVLGQQGRLGIRVEPVAAAGRADLRPLVEDGEPCLRPLVIHLQRECGSAREERRMLALRACANQIAGMLESRRHVIGDAGLRPGDIAVLLPRHDDIVRLRALLLERRVPCVGASRDSVFATPIARDLLLFLYGIEHAANDAAVRAALATRLGGATYDSLRALRDDPLQWQPIAQRFMGWRARWHSGGVLAAIRDVIAECGPRLVDTADGERALTDLRHLGELLQDASTRIDGVQALLAWFAAQRDAEIESTEAAEEQQLRIESDARRVRLMTLHASKGLEFPVVFLPLMWDHAGRDPKLPVVPDPLNGGRVLDLGSEAFDEAMDQARVEDQDERFRVLYVALTRAQYACHLYALPTDRPDGNSRSPLADPQRSALDAMLARLQAQLPSGERLADIAHHIGWSEGWSWPMVRYRADVEARTPRPRVLSEPAASRMLSKHSFSTLTRSARIDLVEEASATDEVPVPASIEEPARAAHGGEASADEVAHPELEALAAVRGADFGNALHAMFEHRRIGEPMTAQLDLIRASLLEAGVRSRELTVDELVPLLAARVQATLDAPLLSSDATLCLGVLPARSMRAEMEFHFAIDDVAVRALREACAANGEPDLVPMLAASRLNGLMTGKIDLVFEHEGRFHVLDYKGNWLGDRLSAYAPTALRAAMDDHHYRFQALLYTVAVDRYLRQRLPRYRRSDHLGEAIYVFVRAAGLAPGAGVWTQRFDDALIDAVDRTLGVAKEPA
ncbi:UvrD-helicase domain-containing protein [Lysobacter korlensis]|uniref:RecBCD enzyme subunit RecB n=1 Tax=Lysobacter korlensis TaxID=553636 RepID=A0ABV6RPM7_9GAMM